jgi:uncharacterized protein YdbL (DUF1318 family)
MYPSLSRLALLGMLLLTTPLVYAITLHAAKDAGLVGETTEGYLAAVSDPSPDVQGLIEEINAKRHAEYQAISIRTGAELKAIEALAGKKAINKTPAGQYIRLGGKWQKK